MLKLSQRNLLLLAIGLPIAVILARLLPLMLGRLVPTLEAHQALASWVEGLGSVAAIAVALAVAVLDGRRSRIALEKQAELQQQSIDHQVRRDLEGLKARRNAALNSVSAAIKLYESTAVAFSDTKSFIATSKVRESDRAVSKKLLADLNYEHLIEKSDMEIVSQISTIQYDFDRFIEKLVEGEANKEKPDLFYMFLIKSKIPQMRGFGESLGIVFPKSMSSILTHTVEEIAAFNETGPTQDETEASAPTDQLELWETASPTDP